MVFIEKSLHALRSVAPLPLLTILFAGAYGQLPLYSTNQNTYFLNGLSFVKGSLLREDWLANTANPVPFFSFYVSNVVEHVGHFAFYIFHVLLVAAYLVILLFMARSVFNVKMGDKVVLPFVLFFTIMHSHAVYLAFKAFDTGVGDLLIAFATYTTEGMAHQPLLRHFHQPSAFAVILLLSMCLFLQKKYRTAAFFAAVAPWFHAAYFLPAGVMTATFMVVSLKRKGFILSLQAGFIALLVVLVPLIYTLNNFGASSPEIYDRASWILVHFRFPHHANPQVWFDSSSVFQLLWVMGGIYLSRKVPELFVVLLSLFVVAVGLTGIQVLTESDRLAMLLPWRSFVLLVPVSTALIMMKLITSCAPYVKSLGHEKFLVQASYGVLSLLFIAGLFITELHSRIRENSQPQELIEYVSGQCSSGDVYLIPIKWNWFRIDTQCPIFVDYKSHPYRDVEVIEWYERILLAKNLYSAENSGDGMKALDKLRDHATITHIILPSANGLFQTYEGLKTLYDDGDYAVYELPTL